MAKDLGQTLKGERIQSIRLGRRCFVKGKTTVQEVLDQMGREKLSCILVEEGGGLKGIFTERDVLTRIVEPGIDPRTPIEKVMTPKPKTLRGEDSIGEAIRLMSRGGYRHVPIINGQGDVEGVLSVKGLVAYLAEHFPYEIYNLPPDPHQVQRAREGA